jgi:hypothetical protein
MLYTMTSRHYDRNANYLRIILFALNKILANNNRQRNLLHECQAMYASLFSIR